MNYLDKIIIKTFTLLKINMLSMAYKGIGISEEYQDLTSSFFDVVLAKYIDRRKKVVFFDVGANVGEVTKLMLASYDNATIHSFEPNSFTFKELSANVQNQNTFLNNFGLGDVPDQSELYFYNEDKTTGHASIYEKVFDLHKNESISSQSIVIDTLDNYCESNKIGHIDFLKIDTEGNDFNVLKGSVEMLSRRGISIIQFEFNEMNVISRVFLKDFYDLLPQYDLFRIKGNSLYPLGEYSSSNEIFKLQNIIAIRQ